MGERATGETVLIYGGPVHILDGVSPPQEALVVSHGRVAAAGSLEEMRRLAGRGAYRIDVAGASVIPGLIDTHPHLMHFSAFAQTFVNLANARDHADIVERIRARAAVTPRGGWIMATPVGEPFYFIRRSYRDLAERCLPDRRVLDRATRDHPVMIHAWGPVTPNVCAFNTAGLRAVGITDFIPGRVCDVWIDKDDEGSVTGILRGSVNHYYSFDPYWTQILLRLPAAEVDLKQAARQGMAAYNRLGVTTVYEAHNMRPPHIEAYRVLRAEGGLTVRVMAAMEAEPYAIPPFQPKSLEEFAQSLDLARSLNEAGDDFFRVSGVTLSEGGPCWPGYLRMLEAYKDPYGRATKGKRFITCEKEEAFVRFCASQGLRANFVAGGFADHEDFLGVLEAEATKNDIAGRSWVVHHAIVITEVQARRYKDLGFDVATSMSFSWGKGDIYGERIGPHVWRDLVPLKRLLNAGLTVACGSDWGPKNIFEHIQLGQTHRFAGSGRYNATPDHVVSREEAVAMWTRDAASVVNLTLLYIWRSWPRCAQRAHSKQRPGDSGCGCPDSP